ncbi:MAG: hypothetical protein K9G60_01915 [Pseudolabrys sp.]|nr:hypothetical protein [Pseudolabrys sp.]
MSRFGITAPTLPNVEFDSVQALRDHADEAIRAQSLIDQLNRDGDVDAFSVDMAGLGFDWNEVAAMATSRQRIGELFVAT